MVAMAGVVILAMAIIKVVILSIFGLALGLNIAGEQLARWRRDPGDPKHPDFKGGSGAKPADVSGQR